MRKEALIVCILVMGLIFAQGALGQAEELKVPFSAIKSSCYGEIDMSQAEFDLSEVGERCVNEDWLEEHKYELENKKEKQDSSEKQVEEGGYKVKIVSNSEKNAVQVSWEQPLTQSKTNQLIVEVYDKSYVHESYIEGEKTATVTFLIFHDEDSGWGQAIKGLPKNKFTGPGGFVEKTKLPLKEKGDMWSGKISINLKKSVKSIGIWKDPNTSQEGFYGIRLKALEPQIRQLVESKPTLEKVIEVIDTPKELLEFMNAYFTNKFRKGHVSYPPEKFLETKQGDCKDWAVFSAYVLKENGYESKQLTYSPEKQQGAHLISIYWQNEEIYYITTKLKEAQLYGPFQNIKEVLQNEVKRRTDLNNEEITCYTLAPPTKLKIEKRCLFS